MNFVNISLFLASVVMAGFALVICFGTAIHFKGLDRYGWAAVYFGCGILFVLFPALVSYVLTTPLQPPQPATVSLDWAAGLMIVIIQLILIGLLVRDRHIRINATE